MSLLHQCAMSSKTIRIHPRDFAELVNRLNSAIHPSDKKYVAAEFFACQQIQREPFTEYVFQVDSSVPIDYSERIKWRGPLPR